MTKNELANYKAYLKLAFSILIAGTVGSYSNSTALGFLALGISLLYVVVESEKASV